MSSALVGIGPTPVEVPPVVQALAAHLWSGTTVVPVWRNEYGGITVRLEDRRAQTAAVGDGAHGTGRQELVRRPRRGSRRRLARLNSPGHKNARRRARGAYLKWVPRHAPCPDPLAEADRLAWADPHVPVPRVLDVGRDARGSWLVTAPVEAEGAIATSAIEPQWRALAERSAVALGAGLRRFHDALPTETCPFVRTAELRVADLTTAPTAPLTAAERATISSTLGSPPAVDRLVVCHGDATVPNTLLDQAGRFAAHVDVGDLGVADRWSDLAVTTRSVTRRYGPGLEPLVLAAYGVAPDDERTTYYRALWDAEEAVRTRRAS